MDGRRKPGLCCRLSWEEELRWTIMESEQPIFQERKPRPRPSVGIPPGELRVARLCSGLSVGQLGDPLNGSLPFGSACTDPPASPSLAVCAGARSPASALTQLYRCLPKPRSRQSRESQRGCLLPPQSPAGGARRTRFLAKSFIPSPGVLRRFAVVRQRCRCAHPVAAHFAGTRAARRFSVWASGRGESARGRLGGALWLCTGFAYPGSSHGPRSAPPHARGPEAGR